MRELKFRAWHKNRHGQGKGDWVKPGSTASFSGGDKENVLEPDKDDVVLLQYTGLEDKNGREIYEGDIVKIFRKHPGASNEKWWPWDTMPNFLVEWESDHYQLRALAEHWGRPMQLFKRPCEVIGNIYENPELRDRSAAA